MGYYSFVPSLLDNVYTMNKAVLNIVPTGVNTEI